MKTSHWLLMGAACAACCAPLLLPILGGAGLAGGAAAAGGWLARLKLSDIVCLGVIVALAVALMIWGVRKQQNARRAIVEGASCEVGGACDPLASQRSEGNRFP